MDWYFFGTGHGKGPHDGAGAYLKQAIRKEQLRPGSIRLHNASDVVEFLRVSMNLPNPAFPIARRVVNMHFYLIEETGVPRERPLGCNTIPSSISMHIICSISHLNNYQLECRDFSCFCNACVLRTNETYPNSFHVAK